jgi:hypothetical protein
LTAEDLKELGIASVGHRRRLVEAIATVRDGGVWPAAEERYREAIEIARAKSRELRAATTSLARL